MPIQLRRGPQVRHRARDALVRIVPFLAAQGFPFHRGCRGSTRRGMGLHRRHDESAPGRGGRLGVNCAACAWREWQEGHYRPDPEWSRSGGTPQEKIRSNTYT